MLTRKQKGIISFALTSCLAFTTEFGVLAANPQSEAQAIETINYESYMSPLASTWEALPALASLAGDTQEWKGKALPNTNSEMNIYKEAKDGSAAIAKMYKNTIVSVEETNVEGWSKVTSGSITGYVKTEKLLFGTDAVKRAETACAKGTTEARKVEHINNEKLLAALIYCEAGNQLYDGKVAVGAGVLNRVNSSRFPNSIKSVIYQRGQFTPAMTGKLDRVLASGNIPKSCYDAARDALNGANPIGSRLFFSTGGGGYKLGDHYFR